MADFIIKYRWIIVSAALLLGAGFGLMLPSAETDPEIRNYIPVTMPSRVTTDSIEKEFGSQDMIIALFTDSSVLTPENLRQIRDADRAISRLEGIGTRNSLFTARKIQSVDGMMIVDPLIRRMPESEEDFSQLQQDILTSQFARDIVISSDFTSAAITGNIRKSVPEHVTLERIDSILTVTEGHADVLTGGLPYIRRFILEDVNRDALVLIPLALIIMLTVLKLTLREWRSVLMPFSVVVISTIISMGLIPLLGWKISIISLLLPVILISVANNYGIYLVSRYHEIQGQEIPPGRKESVRIITGSLNKPILFTGLTTIAGVLGLLSHSIIPARQLGLLAATGILLALTLSLLLIPALIYLRKPVSRKVISAGRKGDIIDRAVGIISKGVTKHPSRVLLISGLVTLSFSAGILLLRIDTNQENYFPASHPLRKASKIINTNFGGSQTISVMIKGDLMDPVIMSRIDLLTTHLKSVDGVGNVFSVSDVAREMSKALFDPGEEDYDQIPSTSEAIAQMFELYNMSGDPDDFSQLMNFEYNRAHMLIRLSNPDNHIIRSVRDEIESSTADFPADVTVGGYAIIMADFANKIIKGQVSSLLIALITVFILLSIVFRSARGGLIASIPLAASIVIQFGFMGAVGIPIDAATALLSSIMIGVGVDFTIQYLWRYKSELNRGLNHIEAIAATFRTTGRTIIINALSVMAGFSATFFSGFLSIRYFGYMVLLSLGSCLLFAIIVIPAFMIRFKPAFIERDIKEREIRRIRIDKNNETYEDEEVITTVAISDRPRIEGIGAAS